MAEFSENWDPMREDYYNDTINSYDTGPGSRLPRNQQPANFRKSESQPVKLYLFPMDGYTKESLNNIFSRFGEVTEVYIDAKAHKWAFVSMKTQAAAERALREVSNHPQLKFKCQYAKEKLDPTTSISETGSPAEVNLRQTEDIPQTGPQFINNFKQKSMLDRGSMGDRGVPETSERRPNNLNNGYQEPVAMNGVAQPVPSCYYCKRQTLETCMGCGHPFCSRKCMIFGYEGHDKNCIRIPKHSAEQTAQPPVQSKMPMTMPQPTPGMMPQPTPGMMPQQTPNMMPQQTPGMMPHPGPVMMPQSAPVMNGQPYDPYSRTICEEFADTSRNYVNSFKQPPASVNVSNSYRTEDNDYHVQSGENHSQNFHDRRAPVSNEYNKSETYRPNSSESQRRSENVQTNGSHRMNDYQSGRESATRSKPPADDDDCPNIEFDLSSKAGRRLPGRRERDGKGHRSSKEGSPWDSQTPGSGYRSSNEYETSRPKRETESSWDSRTPGSGHRSSNEYETSRPKRESESSRNSRRTPPPGHRSNRENTSRDKRDNRDEGSGHRPSQQRESRDDRSQASGYRSSRENASRDSRGDGAERRPKRESWDDQLHESGNRPRKENDSSWANRSKGSGYRSNENASSRDRQPPGSNHRSNAENGSSWNESSRNQSNKENEPSWDDRSQTSRCSHRETVPSKDSESPVSEFAGNRSSSEMKSDDNPRRRSGSFDHTERNNSSRSKDPELPRLFRVRIEEHSRFKVKLAENGPLAVMIQEESNSLNEMIDALQKFYREPLTDELCKGMKCIARKTPGDHNTWYRCMLHQVDPFSVRFIDFSHEPELVRKEDVRIMPEPFRLLNPYCYRVEFMNAEPEELNELKIDDSVLEVEFLRKEQFKWQVNLVRKPFEEELKEARSIRDAKKPSESPRRPPSNINNHPELKVVLQEDTPIEVLVTHIENKSKIFVTVWDKVDKLTKLIEESNCSSLPELKDLRLNTTCFSLYEKSWYRARIVSVDPLTVFYIDFGNTESADRKNLKTVPDQLLWIDPLVVAIKFRNEPNLPITPDQTIKIIPIEELSAEKVWIVRLVSEPEAPVQRGSMPEPASEEVIEKSYAPKVEVGEILDVQVTFIVSNSEYYVGPKDIFDKLKLLSVEDEDVKPAGSLKNVSLGMQCVKAFDGVWSRAKIVKLDPLTIFFVDFGNSEKVNQKDLYPCPENLRKTPPLAYKICLQEPRDLEEYVAYKIKKVSDKLWSVVDEPPFAPKANSSVS